jgi:hypothetical protein
MQLLIASPHVYKLGHWVAYIPKPDLITFSYQSSVFQQSSRRSPLHHKVLLTQSILPQTSRLERQTHLVYNPFIVGHSLQLRHCIGDLDDISAPLLLPRLGRSNLYQSETATLQKLIQVEP